MRWYLNGLKQYAVFKGRATRKEYWMFFFVSIAILVVLAAVEAIIGIADTSRRGLLVGAYSVAVLLPTLALTVRRLHDTRRTGWWLLIVLVPYVGVVILLVMMAQGSRSDEVKQPPAEAPPTAGLVAVDSGSSGELPLRSGLGAIAGPTSRLFALNSFVTLKRAPAPGSTTLTACISGADGELVALAPMVFNALSEEWRRQFQSGIDLVAPDGEKLLNLKARSAFVLRTQAWEVVAPGEGIVGSFEHRDLFLFRDQWSFRDSGGRPIGLVKETVEWKTFLRILPLVGGLFGDQEYTIRIGDRVIATIHQVGIGLHTSVSSDISGAMERQMVVAFCVLRTLQTG